jgi:hypothetical protein
VRAAAVHPGTWLFAVVTLVYVNQFLLTVYLLRVHGGDPAFVARYLPPEWFHIARGPVVESLAAVFPAPHLLAPSVLRVQSFLELPFGILLYLVIVRWLDLGLYRRLGSGALLWAGCLSVSGVFCWVEWLLRSPWTTGDLWIRAVSTVVTPLAIARLVGAAPVGAARGTQCSFRGWLAFLASAGALGVLVLVVYDTAMLYNLAYVGTAAPVAILALIVLGIARFAARVPGDTGAPEPPGVRGVVDDPILVDGRGRSGHGMDTLITGMAWFLAVFFVPAMPVRYGLAVITSWTAIPAVLVLVGVAGLGTLREVGTRVRDRAVGERAALLRWLAGLLAAGTTGLLVAAVVATMSARYPETRIFSAAIAFLLTVTGVSALTDRWDRSYTRPGELPTTDNETFSRHEKARQGSPDTRC